jgi:ribonuclease D
MEPFERIELDRILVVATAEDAARAQTELANARVVGFDTEARPTFFKGEVSDGPHVVQFSLAERAYVFQLQDAQCRAVAAAILGSAEILKVGFSLGSDRQQILRTLGVRMQNVLDLDTIFKRNGYQRNVGVKSAIALLFSRRFSKSKKVSTSNWSNRELSDAQVVYAANDAYAALHVFQALQLSES